MTARKSPERRQGKAGTTRDAKILELRPDAPSVPPAPHWPAKRLLKRTVTAWEGFHRSGLGRMVDPADMPALGRLFRMYDERDRFDAILIATPFVTGSTGQVVAHPAARVVASLDERILKLESRFGITPKGRMDLGIAFGAAVKSIEDLDVQFAQGEDHQEDDDPDVYEDPRRRAIDV